MSGPEVSWCSRSGTTGSPRSHACPLFEATFERLAQTFERAGINVRTGLRLGRIFRDAGLPAPQLLQSAHVDGGPDSAVYALIAETTRTVLPLMERTGVATTDEVAVETLAARLRAEAVALDAVLVHPPLVGAWARKEAA